MFILLLLFIYGLLHPSLISSSTRDSLSLFVTYILPSLFFYMLILDMLFKLKSLNKATNKLFKIFKLFKIRCNCSVLILIFCLFVGNPTNAKNIVDLLTSKKIDDNEANYLLSTTHYASIGFTISFVGLILNNYSLCIIIIISNIISNLLLMLFTNNNGEIVSNNITYQRIDFSSSLTNTINVLIMICSITLFSGIVIDILLNLNYPKNLLGFIEITRGIKELNNLRMDLIVSLISAFVSFGGISIHLQIYNIIKDKINYKLFLIRRIICSAISFLLCYLICSLIT